MNFLQHPLYTLLALAASIWLSVANGRGITPLSWASGSGGSARSTLGYSHGFSHMSHK